jgi:endoglucanase
MTRWTGRLGLWLSMGVAAAACGGGDGGPAGDNGVEGGADTLSPSDDGGSPSDDSPNPPGDAAPNGDAGSDAAPASVGLHVSGNKLVDSNNQPVRLLGVNRSGSEYACIDNFGFFDGPSDDASVAAIAGWKANAVRVPLNEDCWLAINGAPAQYSGMAYQQAISAYVDLLIKHSLYPILELHWNGAGTTKATGQQPMPDEDHAPTFWSQVATAFMGRGNVIFELYNEPWPDNNQDTTAAWTCWRDGGNCPSISFPVAGMQSLVTTVRGTGAKNVILLGGVQYSNALSQWLTFKPTDPENNLAAAWHIYNFNNCDTTTCFDQTAGAVAQEVPIVATEIGEDDCGGAFITSIMGWLDSHNQNYLAWVWDTWGTQCSAIALVTDYTGTANGTYGTTYKTHLASTPH